jgi:recombination protein RecA
LVTRRKITAPAEPASVLPPANEQKFFSSGCALLDCVLGGGWARGKVINVVGDRSSGKTLLAIEASANYVRVTPAGRVKYIEGEDAFDPEYARSVGFPEHGVDFVSDVRTVEQLFMHIDDAAKSKEETLVIVDSLDSLSDAAELKRDLGEASYGAAKSKILSEGFRRYIADMGAANLTLFVISQIRDNMNAMAFAKKTQRSGGRALDFYASQVLWLYETGKIKKTVSGIERAIGMNVKARCEKNKVGWPWRECEIPILYGYGVDDIKAALEWLSKASPDSITTLGPDDQGQSINKDSWKRRKLDRTRVAELVRIEWERIDREFRPESRKYD